MRCHHGINEEWRKLRIGLNPGEWPGERAQAVVCWHNGLCPISLAYIRKASLLQGLRYLTGVLLPHTKATSMLLQKVHHALLASRHMARIDLIIGKHYTPTRLEDAIKLLHRGLHILGVR